MQKVILDTNVIVSALIANSLPTKILYELALTRSIEVCLSEEVFAEYVAVLARDKFKKFPAFNTKADVVLNKLREIAIFHRPTRRVELLKDLSDNKFLELAAISAADYLLTGNTLDFTISEFEYTRILTPRAYWDECRP